MDSIFEEESEEVGGEIEAYCPSPRCKADTAHTIISMYEGEVRRVQCAVCGEVHQYRKPRGDSAEEAAEAVPKRPTSKKLTWDECVVRTPEADLQNCRPYSIRDTYEVGDVVHHPVFDIGFVIELLSDNKVEIIFKDDTRVLVHNRGDLASRMPDISEIPAPREAKKKKRSKRPDVADQPVQRERAAMGSALDMARNAATARMEEATRTADAASKVRAKNAKLKPPPQPASAKASKSAGNASTNASTNASANAANSGGKKAAPPAAKKAPGKAAPPAKATAKKPAAKKPPAKKPPAKKPAAKKPAAKKPAAKKPTAKKPAAKKPPAKKPAKKKR